MENAKNYYFTIIKLCCMIILVIYFISNNEKSLSAISVEWFLLAVTFVIVLGFEIAGRKRTLFLVGEAIMALVLLLFFPESGNGLLFFPMVILDIITFCKLPFYLSLLSLFGVFLQPQNLFLYIIYCFFLGIIYFQNFMVILRYRKYLNDFEQEEYRLKDSIRSRDTFFNEELKKSSLTFENRMLEEKARLSQALHDKLGHSINGSIYQLEASKVLMEKEPEESKRIVQMVIDNLRTSMDEIRYILRREKPDRKRMAQLQLIGLCEECKDRYGIHAEVAFKGEDRSISENLWDIILDNTFEAVTNALKYAKCTRISIEITILHKVVRCSITDNGQGCDIVKEGMGIQGMKNRARKVNGYIDVNGENGFCINMILPIQE
ncbi:MAG TPA: histidine kinase [Lachnospiraceae bacterium]|nr:histidine kinase [Lachnospiraceae bacterium]